MEASAIDTGLATASALTPTGRGFTDLKSEDFFALLIEEMKSQDPLKPKDNQQILAQMSTIREMEQSSLLNETLKSLAAEQRFGATSGLIGHFVAGRVQGQSGNSVEVQGLVIGVRFEQNGKGILELHNGKQLPAENVEQVTLIENLPPEILEQLRAELDIPLPGDPADSDDEAPDDEPDEGDPGDDPPTENASARAIRADRAGRQAPGAFIRTLGEQADSVAGIMDALIAPGIGVEI